MCGYIMEIITKGLNWFVFIILLIILLLCFPYFVIYASSFSAQIKLDEAILIKIFTLISGICILLFVFRKNRLGVWAFKLTNQLSIRNTLILILLFGFILRILWILLVPTVPHSDFGMMYKYAQEVQQGNYNGFHNYAYFARFAHDTVTVLYFSLFYNFTTNPLLLIKLINVLFSTLAVYYMYKIVAKIYNETLGLLAAFLLAIFPPFIMYNSQTMSENLAVPFYLISVYYFVLIIKNESTFHENESKYLFFCGLALSMANMFRMVGSVFLIAYIIHFILYKGLKKSVLRLPIIIATYFIPLYLISSLLIYNGITETHLWKSKEPSWTSVLKGTNFESIGHWNVEDAKLPDIYNHDPDKIAQASKQIIKDRLSNASLQKISTFYLYKFGSEWAVPDMSAYDWTVPDASVSNSSATKFLRRFESTVLIPSTLFYLFLLYFSILSLMKNKGRPEEISFFLILFSGFVMLLLITEAQARYAFIISWIFIIFAIGGLKSNHDTNFKVHPSRSFKYSNFLCYLFSIGRLF